MILEGLIPKTDTSQESLVQKMRELVVKVYGADAELLPSTLQILARAFANRLNPYMVDHVDSLILLRLNSYQPGRDLTAWLAAQCEGQYQVLMQGRFVAFTSDNDALLFKMSWDDVNS